MKTAWLLERDREIRVIGDALDEAVAGNGGMVLVEGPAGIGKSALVEAAREAALDRNLAVARARGSELERADAFGVVRQLFEPRLRALTASGRERALGGAAALARSVVLPETAPATAGEGSSFATLHGLYWLTAGLAANRPQLLAVDDVHWADEASVRYLQFLANRLEELPVLVVAAQRPDPTAPAATLRAMPSVTSMTPAALSVAATAATLGGDGADVAPGFAAACHAATGGNPLLVSRLALGLRERGVPFSESGVAQLRRVGADVVADAVDAAMARLTGDSARLARAVAVLGDAPLPVAAALAELPAEAAPGAADQLVRAGILEDGRPLRFQHALVRDAVLDALTAGERAEHHRRAAQLLVSRGAPDRAIATHLLHAEPRGDPAVVATLAAEGHRALAAGAPSEARDLLARALAEPPRPDQRHALLLGLARATQSLGETGAFDLVRDAYRSTGDAVERAHAALALTWVASSRHDEVAEVLTMVEPAIAGVADRDRDLELQLRAARLMLIFFTPELLPQWLGEAGGYSELDGATVGECLLLLNASLQRFVIGRAAADVAAPIERVAENDAVLAEISPDAPWLPLLIGQLFKADRLDAASRVAEAALTNARRVGSSAAFAIVSASHSWIALRRGDAAAAEAHARAALDNAPAGTWQHTTCRAGLAEVLVERAQLDEAATLVGDDGAVPMYRTSDLLVAARSLLRAARGEPEAALHDQKEVRRRSGAGLANHLDFDGWLRIALLLHVLGNDEEARREADAALGWARTFGTPGHLGQALTVVGLLDGGPDGLTNLHAAVEALERSPARRELARSLIELGAALRRAGRRVDAREVLRRGLDIAAAGGLTASAERARQELRATGARVRRDHATGVASLTPSERRIAERAATGASNPEIAQALFVTTKTVEMHLSSAYRKLGIASRAALSDRLPKDQGESPG